MSLYRFLIFIVNFQRLLSNRLRSLFWGAVLEAKGLRTNGRVYLMYLPRIRCGKNVSINKSAILNAKGGLTIGDSVTISGGAQVLTTGIVNGAHISKGVTLNRNVWIGSNAIVLPGVEIAEGVTIGASSVVTKSISERNSTYACNPAKKLP